MPSSDILKLIFHHDQRISDLRGDSAEEAEQDLLSMFTAPDPTYSSLYFAGTDLKNQKFGLSALQHFSDIQEVIISSLAAYLDLNQSEIKRVNEFLAKGSPSASLSLKHGKAEITDHVPGSSETADLLEKGHILLLLKEAADGFDIHIISKQNIYRIFFAPLQKMLPASFRFFSINGKRLRNERYFYFDIWSLEKPPHGFEEVFPESVL